jgi:hypothetical protein
MADEKERDIGRRALEAFGLKDSSLRRTLESAADPIVPGASAPDSTVTSAGGSAPSNKAVLGLCDLLGLVFALPFGEDLYHDTPITGAHIGYLVVGLMLAAFGHLWPRIKASLPARLSHTVTLAALDFRVWLGVLLVVFIISVAPEVYQRATTPSPTAEDIAKAVVRAMPANSAPPPQAAARQSGQPAEASSPILRLTDATRWRFITAFLEAARAGNGGPAKCFATVSIKSQSASTNSLWAEFQPLLSYANWQIAGASGNNFYKDGITILTNSPANADPFICATKLAQLLQSMTPIAVTIRKEPTQVLEGEQCKNECVEIQIGDAGVR